MMRGHLLQRIQSFFVAFLDAILPPFEHTARTRTRSFSTIPLHFATHALLGTHITTLMDYRKTEVQDLIRSLKYDGNDHAARLCAMILSDYLREEIASVRMFSPRPIFIIPLPLHRMRLQDRGFNQINIVLERLPVEFRDGSIASVVTDALIRTRDTPHQTTLPRSDRLHNVRSAFAISDHVQLRHAHVFLIDDVTTTGATLVSAGKEFAQSKAQVALIALARA